MRVAACHLKDTLHTLTKQIWCVHILQDGLQVVHHQLKPTKQGPKKHLLHGTTQYTIFTSVLA